MNIFNERVIYLLRNHGLQLYKQRWVPLEHPNRRWCKLNPTCWIELFRLFHLFLYLNSSESENTAEKKKFNTENDFCSKFGSTS